MKASIALIAILLTANSGLLGQALPTATVSTAPAYNPGPGLPVIDGNLQYGLTAAENVQFGYSGSSGRSEVSSLSGDVEYLTKSTTHPFSLLYAGGLFYSTYSNQGVQTFQSMTASQGLVYGRWALGISDSVSYLPQSPTTGLSGIPGLGDQGLLPISNPLAPSQAVLTNYGSRISNAVSGNVERQLSGRTSVSGTGSYGTLSFLSGSGLSSRQISGQVGLNYALDRRSSVSLGAQYSTFSYSDNSSTFNARGLNLGYSRQLRKDLSFSASVGPQWVSSFQAFPTYLLPPGLIPPAGINVPSRLSVAASGGLSYLYKHVSASLAYSRGVNSGSGVQIGSYGDSLSAQVSRGWGRNWSAAATGAYSRMSGLALTGTTSTFYTGAQVTRRLGLHFSTYGSYTAVHQSIPAYLGFQNAFSGFSQSVGVGITYSPRAARLGQF